MSDIIQEKLKEILNKDNYKFIHSNENLGDNIIYLTLSGSIGYGTNLDSSDIDLRGITIEKTTECFSKG